MSGGIEGFIFYSGPGGMGWGDVSGVRGQGGSRVRVGVRVRGQGWGQGWGQG